MRPGTRQAVGGLSLRPTGSMVCFSCFTGGGERQTSKRGNAKMSSKRLASSAPIRALLIGDSLTEGYYSHGMRFHPYASKLTTLAYEARLADFQVTKEGVSGDVVVPSMIKRLSKTLRDATLHGMKYSHVFILGGTNDLGLRNDAVTVFEGLKAMYQDVLNHGARVVAMTLFGYRESLTTNAAIEEQLVELNKMIRQWAQQQAIEGQKVTLVDLEKHFASKRKDALMPYWDDLIHLTPLGYDYLGQVLWDEVILPQATVVSRINKQ